MISVILPSWLPSSAQIPLNAWGPEINTGLQELQVPLLYRSAAIEYISFSVVPFIIIDLGVKLSLLQIFFLFFDMIQITKNFSFVYI